MKEQMIKDMTERVKEVAEAGQAVNSVMDAIEDTKASAKQTLSALEHELQDKQEALAKAQDVTKAKALRKEIASLEEDIELEKTVGQARVNARIVEIEDKAEAFFALHKSARFMYSAVDKHMILNTSLSELTEAKKTMQGFSRELANDFSRVTAILRATGIVTQATVQYKGIHLGQSSIQTELSNFDNKVRGYIHSLKGALGVEIK